MKISEIENRAYQWIGKDGGWQVGKPLRINGELETKGVYAKGQYIGEQIAMQPSHASPPTWVRLDDLHPYPAELIEELIVKGGE